MANALNLIIGIIGLTGVPFTVPNRTALTDLTASNVLIKKYNGTAFVDFVDFALAAVSPTGATIDPTTDFNENDLLLIQIVDGTDKSDRVSVDFSENYDANDAIVPFALPDEAGTYNLNIKTVNENDFSAVAASRDFVVGNAPDTANSSIALDYKKYLVKYVGTKVNVKIVLQNSTNNAAIGNYEVVFKATKQ